MWDDDMLKVLANLHVLGISTSVLWFTVSKGHKLL